MSQYRRAMSIRDRGIGSYRAGNVFEVFAQIDELNADLASDVLVSRRLDADAAGRCDAFKPCRNIYAIAEDVMWLDNYVADIYADTESDTGVFRVGGCKFFDAGLKLHSGSNRSHRTWKLRQEPVAGMLEDATTVFRNRRADSLR
jgi:hypothetical protein